MQTRSRVTRAFAAAAMTGLLAGTVSSTMGCKSGNPDNNQAGMSADSAGTSSATQAKHDCAGQNNCKGQGGCKSGDNGCKGKNSCKGKGGCSTNVQMTP
jgi:hypothetical protein